MARISASFSLELSKMELLLVKEGLQNLHRLQAENVGDEDAAHHNEPIEGLLRSISRVLDDRFYH